jgi:death on curing protein
MIEVQEALLIHQVLIEKFGGSHGLRDRGLLESALARPFQTFNGEELHPGPIEKAAALIESLLSNHPFIDGNKRTGYVLMRLLLLDAGMDLSATQQEKYDFVMRIASGKSPLDQITSWIREHTT